MYLSALIMIFAVYSVINISGTYTENQKIVSRRQQVNESLTTQKEKLEIYIEFQKTQEYLEIETRKRFNYKKQGEYVLSRPNLLDRAKTERELIQENKEEPPDKSNFEQWMDYLMGRS
jgi:hypothetical protein